MSIIPTTWRGAAAWLIQGDRIEAVVTAIGGHLACLRNRGETLNPLWQPTWPWADPAALPAGGEAYGGWPVAPTLATIVGSNLCLDRFGDPWPGERRPLHGEAGVVPWTCVARGDGAELTTALPEARLLVRRRIACTGDSLVLATAVCHDGLEPRAVEWCEHTTIGDPFLDGAHLTAGVSRVFTPPFGGADIRELPLADAAVRAPAADDPPMGSVRSAVVDEPWWQADNRRLGRRLRVTWRRDDFPFLAIWTEHRARAAAPWHGRGRTRGMELTTKPFPESRPPAERAERFAGRPTVCLVPPGAWREHEVRFTWTSLDV